MPFQDEASKFVALAKKYISSDSHKEFIVKLDEELGQKTSDEALKHFFSMARFIVDPPFVPAPWYWWLAFYALVTAHLSLVLGVILSFFLLPFYAPWYVALPLMAFIWFFSTTSVECKLTQLENYIRKRIGLKRIGGFVGHYLIRPSRRLARRAVGMKVPPLRFWRAPRPPKPSENSPARN